jgi:retinol dehydrogenase-12
MVVLTALIRFFTALTTSSLGYVIMLTIFRTSVLENDSFFNSLLEILFSASLTAIVWYSDLLLSDPKNLVSLHALLGGAAWYFAYKMHGFYVSGRQYRHVPLDGKFYIITGSNTGLGYETALRIVSMGGNVVLACRNVDRAKEAKEKILALTKCAPTKVFVLKLDLCGFDSVRKFIKEFRALNVPLHGLVNNAGVMMQDRSLTQDGFEMVFTANHLSHFLLTHLLLPELKKTDGRIVNVSSCLHKMAKEFNFDDVMSERNYTLFGTYSQSKLANILFTFELQKRLKAEGSRVTCNVVHPGCVRTEVTRNMGVVMRAANALVAPFLLMLQKTPHEGAYCTIHVATAPELEGIGGRFFFHCQEITPAPCALDAAAAEKLWRLSEKLTGIAS